MYISTLNFKIFFKKGEIYNTILIQMHLRERGPIIPPKRTHI